MADPSGGVRGIIDVTVEGESATIDTIAVHPGHRSRGIGRALLGEATARLLALKVAALDAWTRDDPATLRWHRSNGFSETDHYLHDYADYYTDAAEPDRAIAERRRGLRPVKAFLHAKLDEEATMRERFMSAGASRGNSAGDPTPS